MNRQLWVCEPRTGPTGWLVPESGPGIDSHVSLGQPSHGNSRSLHLQESCFCLEPLLPSHANPGIPLGAGQKWGGTKSSFSGLPHGAKVPSSE